MALENSSFFHSYLIFYYCYIYTRYICGDKAVKHIAQEGHIMPHFFDEVTFPTMVKLYQICRCTVKLACVAVWKVELKEWNFQIHVLLNKHFDSKFESMLLLHDRVRERIPSQTFLCGVL